MSCLSYEDMYPLYDAWLSESDGRSHALAVINVHICVSALFSKALRDMYNAADLVAIDSMPFLLCARMFCNPRADRFYAPDLMLQVSEVAKEKGYRFFLYGGYPGAPERIESFLSQRFEGIEVVGKYSPPFRDLTAVEENAICEMINAARPDFLWVGLGSPKQDIWIRDRLEKIRGCVMVPSGATFDFFSGRIRQAPAWIRNIGMEWFFRLTQDFRRLWRRYTLYNLIFLTFYCLQLVRVVTFDEEGYLRLFGRPTRFGNT